MIQYERAEEFANLWKSRLSKVWKGRWGVGSQRTFDEPCWECHKRFSLKFKQTDLSKKSFAQNQVVFRQNVFSPFYCTTQPKQSRCGFNVRCKLKEIIHVCLPTASCSFFTFALSLLTGLNVIFKLKFEILHGCIPTVSWSFFGPWHFTSISSVNWKFNLSQQLSSKKVTLK